MLDMCGFMRILRPPFRQILQCERGTIVVLFSLLLPILAMGSVGVAEGGPLQWGRISVVTHPSSDPARPAHSLRPFCAYCAIK